MDKAKTTAAPTVAVESDFFDRLWEESWTYIKTVVDVVREPILILNKDLCVMAANESFYRMFKVDMKETEHQLIYELGNGQWNIPSLRQLLEDILPNNTYFKGFEVTHTFPEIGKKVIILNARQIHKEVNGSGSFPPIIMLAMEDVTEMINVAEMLARHTNQFEVKMMERSEKLESDMKAVEETLRELRNEYAAKNK